MKRLLSIDDNGQGLETILNLLREHGYAAQEAADELSEVRDVLRESENRFRMIVETAEEGIWQVDRDWKTTYVNRRMEGMLGCEPGSMLGLHIHDFMDDEGRRAVLEHISRREQGISETHDFRFVRRDGSMFDVLVSANPLLDARGEVVGSLAMVTDITDRKQAADELQRSKDLLQAIIDAAPTAIIGLDLDGRVQTVWNHAAEKMLGWSAEEAMGRYLPSVTADKKEEFQRFRESIRSGKTLNGKEVRRQRRDGTPIDYSIYASPLHGLDGQIIGNIAVLVDITERRRADELLRENLSRLQTMVRNAPVVIYGVDRHGIFTLSEGKGLAGMGLKPGEIVGRSAFDVYRDHPEGLENFHRALAGEAFTVPVHFGNHVYDAYHEPVFEDDGEYAGTLGVLVDVTERTRAEEALRQAKLVIENSPAVLFRWRAAEGWPVEMVSGNVIQFGYSPEELLSGLVPFSSLVYPEDLERVAAEVAEYARRGEERFQQEYRIVTSKGEVRWVDGRTVIECDVDGRVTQFQGVVMDITDRKRTESVMSARMRLLEFAATHTLEELLEATLNEAEALTGSCIGFYHYLEADQKTLSLQNWSTRTKKEFCRAEGKGLHYDVSAAGVWVDCIRQRRPIIHNDYASLPHRKGLPPGHAPVVRELVVPVFRGESIEAIFGVGNKACDYTRQDVETVSLLADLAWGIAEQKRVEESLRVSELKYRDIVEHAPFGISRSTSDGGLLSVNPAFARILKYDSPEQLLETVNRSSVQDVLFEDPLRRDILVEQIFTGDSWHVFENRYRCKDGSVITCKVHSRRIPDKEGGGREFESFLENITERLEAEKALRESEEKFRVLAETSPTAIFLYQGEMIVYANPATERLFGYGADELLRMSFWDWAHEDFREMVRDRGLKRLRGEPVPARYESRFVTKAGEDRWLVVSAGLIDYHGRATGVASFLDITDIKKAEQQLQTSLAEKEILLKEVHHRVKNNLQIISSLLELQSEYIVEEHSRRFIKESQDRITSIALVHEQLYRSTDLSFIDFACYVDELVDSLCRSLLRDPERIRVKVEIRDIELGIDEAIPCGLIINELVSNSLKHAFPGDGEGEILIRSARDGEGGVRLSVTDTGIGLPPGLNLLETETLGLQIVGLLTRQLQGTMEIHGEHGVTVTVCFPEKA